MLLRMRVSQSGCIPITETSFGCAFLFVSGLHLTGLSWPMAHPSVYSCGTNAMQPFYKPPALSHHYHHGPSEEEPLLLW